MHHGQTNPAVFNVHANHSHFHLQPGLDHFFCTQGTVFSYFRDVQQPFEMIVQLDECTKGGDLRYKSGQQIANVVVVRDLLQPGVGQELLPPQGDTLFLLVDRKNNALQGVALLDQL